MLRERDEGARGQQGAALLTPNPPNPAVHEQIWKVPEDFSDEVNRETGGLAAISKVYSILILGTNLIKN